MLGSKRTFGWTRSAKKSQAVGQKHGKQPGQGVLRERSKSGNDLRAIQCGVMLEGSWRWRAAIFSGNCLVHIKRAYFYDVYEHSAFAEVSTIVAAKVHLSNLKLFLRAAPAHFEEAEACLVLP